MNDFRSIMLTPAHPGIDGTREKLPVYAEGLTQNRGKQPVGKERGKGRGKQKEEEDEGEKARALKYRDRAAERRSGIEAGTYNDFAAEMITYVQHSQKEEDKTLSEVDKLALKLSKEGRVDLKTLAKIREEEEKERIKREKILKEQKTVKAVEATASSLLAKSILKVSQPENKPKEITLPRRKMYRYDLSDDAETVPALILRSKHEADSDVYI